MNYAQIINKLFNINELGVKFGLSNVQTLLAALQNPETSFQSVHIAGTNGKGSVTTKIAKGLSACNTKVGLFTSPHINCFRERIQINGEMISEEETVNLLTKIFTIQEKLGIKATFFELTTVLAFLYFAKSGVSHAAIETGLGGRLDATNVLLPKLSVITSIALDHTEVLGNTIESITYEKAGIIKEKVPVLIGPRVSKEIIESVAMQKQALLHRVEGAFSNYYEENNAIAKAAMKLLNLPHSAIAEGLQATPPCRFEIIQQQPPVICDVAHNPDGLAALFTNVHSHFPHQPIHLVLGLSKSKDITGCLKILKDQNIARFYLVKANSDRAAEPKELQNILLGMGIPKDSISSFSTVTQGVRTAKQDQNKNLLLITGTFFMMGEARRELGFLEICDSLDLHEPSPKFQK